MKKIQLKLDGDNKSATVATTIPEDDASPMEDILDTVNNSSQYKCLVQNYVDENVGGGGGGVAVSKIYELLTILC